MSEREAVAAVLTEALESLDLLCAAEDKHGDTIRAHEVRDAVSDLRQFAAAQPAIPRAQVAEFQHNALEMARKADLAERRAEDAEAEVERLRAALVEVRQVFDLQCPPMPPDKYVDQGAWMAHSWWNTVLGRVLKRADLIDALRPTPADLCRHGSPEGECPSCTACAACRGECGTCPYVVIPPGETP